MMRILSIDDARAVHAFLKDVFTGLDVELIHAMDGKEGLQKVSEEKTPLDLILLDWEMPGLNGPEVYAKLMATGVKIPIIMLTAKNEIKDIQVMLDQGISEYVMKPFTADILLEKIETVLGKPVPKSSTSGP